jgi:hypothetical protein
LAANQEPLSGMQFRMVLALNIFHHFIKKQETLEKLRLWLNKLDADMMIFEPHVSTESQMVGAYANFDNEEFVRFIIENSSLQHSEMIHRCEDGRSVYKLWR